MSDIKEEIQKLKNEINALLIPHDTDGDSKITIHEIEQAFKQDPQLEEEVKLLVVEIQLLEEKFSIESPDMVLEETQIVVNVPKFLRAEVIKSSTQLKLLFKEQIKLLQRKNDAEKANDSKRVRLIKLELEKLYDKIERARNEFLQLHKHLEKHPDILQAKVVLEEINNCIGNHDECGDVKSTVDKINKVYDDLYKDVDTLSDIIDTYKSQWYNNYGLKIVSAYKDAKKEFSKDSNEHNKEVKNIQETISKVGDILTIMVSATIVGAVGGGVKDFCSGFSNIATGVYTEIAKTTTKKLLGAASLSNIKPQKTSITSIHDLKDNINTYLEEFQSKIKAEFIIPLKETIQAQKRSALKNPDKDAEVKRCIETLNLWVKTKQDIKDKSDKNIKFDKVDLAIAFEKDMWLNWIPSALSDGQGDYETTVGHSAHSKMEVFGFLAAAGTSLKYDTLIAKIPLDVNNAKKEIKRLVEWAEKERQKESNAERLLKKILDL